MGPSGHGGRIGLFEVYIGLDLELLWWACLSVRRHAEATRHVHLSGVLVLVGVTCLLRGYVYMSGHDRGTAAQVHMEKYSTRSCPLDSTQVNQVSTPPVPGCNPPPPTGTNKLGRGPQSRPCPAPAPVSCAPSFGEGWAFNSQRSRLATQDRSAGGVADPGRDTTSNRLDAGSRFPEIIWTSGRPASWPGGSRCRHMGNLQHAYMT